VIANRIIVTVILISFLAGCGAPTVQPTPSRIPLPQMAIPTATLLPTATWAPTTTAAATATPLPSTTPTAIPTATPVPVYLEAVVWASDPQVPILTYHRFYPDRYATSTATKIRLGDFKVHLQALYDAGYSLVPLEAWLKGDFRVPAGRRPLILTIDDLFFADQIFLNPDGSPSIKSGLGLLWQFSQDHPNFGFSVGLFYNFGDKHYGSKEVGDWWNEAPGWEDALAKTIVWCIEHGAIPYNHFYKHPKLDLLNGNELLYLAKENERALKESLGRAGRAELADGLGNIFALPYGIWPTNVAVKKVMLSYVSTNQKPLEAVLEVDFAIRAQYLQPFYSAKFDRNHVPRIVGNADAIKVLTDPKSPILPSAICKLGPVDETQTQDTDYLINLVGAAPQNGCTEGLYVLQGHLFRLKDSQVEEITLAP
jgi:hypothetical protein